MPGVPRYDGVTLGLDNGLNDIPDFTERERGGKTAQSRIEREGAEGEKGADANATPGLQAAMAFARDSLVVAMRSREAGRRFRRGTGIEAEGERERGERGGFNKDRRSH